MTQDNDSRRKKHTSLRKSTVSASRKTRSEHEAKPTTRRRSVYKLAYAAFNKRDGSAKRNTIIGGAGVLCVAVLALSLVDVSGHSPLEYSDVELYPVSENEASNGTPRSGRKLVKIGFVDTDTPQAVQESSSVLAEQLALNALKDRSWDRKFSHVVLRDRVAIKRHESTGVILAKQYSGEGYEKISNNSCQKQLFSFDQPFDGTGYLPQFELGGMGNKATVSCSELLTTEISN